MQQAAVSPADEGLRSAVEQAVDAALDNRQRYRCAACGFEARNHTWHCPACMGWDTYPPRRSEELSLITP